MCMMIFSNGKQEDVMVEKVLRLYRKDKARVIVMTIVSLSGLIAFFL